MFKNCITLEATLHNGSDIIVIWTSGFVIFSYDNKYEPIEWFAGFINFYIKPVFKLLVGVNDKLNPLFPNVAEWHFNLLSPIGRPFKAFMAF